jgi:hypothetical protein
LPDVGLLLERLVNSDVVVFFILLIHVLGFVAVEFIILLLTASFILLCLLDPLLLLLPLPNLSLAELGSPCRPHMDIIRPLGPHINGLFGPYLLLNLD